MSDVNNTQDSVAADGAPIFVIEPVWVFTKPRDYIGDIKRRQSLFRKAVVRNLDILHGFFNVCQCSSDPLFCGEIDIRSTQ